jgi:hypothetical protein
MYSASIRERAPAPATARDNAPPTWRSSTITNGEPDSWPATSTMASIASAVSPSISAWSPMPGMGSSGSMCR